MSAIIDFILFFIPRFVTYSFGVKEVNGQFIALMSDDEFMAAGRKEIKGIADIDCFTWLGFVMPCGNTAKAYIFNEEEEA